jgi:hypothetical protein
MFLHGGHAPCWNRCGSWSLRPRSRSWRDRRRAHHRCRVLGRQPMPLRHAARRGIDWASEWEDRVIHNFALLRVAGHQHGIVRRHPCQDSRCADSAGAFVPRGRSSCRNGLASQRLPTAAPAARRRCGAPRHGGHHRPLEGFELDADDPPRFACSRKPRAACQVSHAREAPTRSMKAGRALHHSGLTRAQFGAASRRCMTEAAPARTRAGWNAVPSPSAATSRSTTRCSTGRTARSRSAENRLCTTALPSSCSPG